MEDIKPFLRLISQDPVGSQNLDVDLRVFADWLDEDHPGTPVRWAHTPGWLCRAWWDLRTANPKLRDFGQQYQLIGPLVATEISSMLMAHHCPWLDHYGSTTIAGIPAFVSEPYCDILACLKECNLFRSCFKPEIVPAFQNYSEWGCGTRRIILFHAAAALTPSSMERAPAIVSAVG